MPVRYAIAEEFGIGPASRGGLSDIYGLKPPPDFTATLSVDGKTITLQFLTADDPIFTYANNVRVYYLSRNEYSPDQIADPATYTNIIHTAPAVQDVLIHRLVTITHLPAEGFVPPGGWFFASSLSATGNDTLTQYTGPVKIQSVPNPNDAPDSTHDVTDVSYRSVTVTINGTSYRQLYFSWTNPVDMGTLDSIQIWLFNYLNRGTYDELMIFNDQKAPLQQQKDCGPVILEPDAALGAHNVTIYFVGLSANRYHRNDITTYPNIVVVGGFA